MIGFYIMRQINIEQGPIESKAEAIKTLWKIVKNDGFKSDDCAMYISFFNGEFLEPISRSGVKVSGYFLRSEPDKFGLTKND